MTSSKLHVKRIIWDCFNTHAKGSGFQGFRILSGGNTGESDGHEIET